ncbi:tRNA uridine-5-carboxymethylaminomethyl(34) synthesis GTPase MnmE [Acetanaerobacterium elongatum]|uniref:tRNA modification GTPase MnmE n=1 Tax=Acetanaerobacterium elongatum TaxID=258515 RepID=A0A1H0DE50_9FIRM|nr:tRNA uridine-5-carboxymethylaminomethyl(34) synthesis GTPase MnmE [Acetanaerobacterium elongatum]SDN68453.1 tRNA modification GTPase [Acetanaerobacterium elongatum]
MSQTIAAIATAQGGAGIGVIRISGDNAREVAARVFTPAAKKKSVLTAAGYTALFGRVYDKNGAIDEAVALVFAAPKSYTGEDVVELSCHGGSFLLQRVLAAVLENGAAPAQAGEFTKRAFLNGKLGLTQAEAVMDIISANGEQAARAALAAHDGALYHKLSGIVAELVSLSASLAAWIDFPEEDVPAVQIDALSAALNSCCAQLDVLIAGYNTTRIVREGIHTVIAGKPNVGKSTLMNLLAGETRSIVTDIPGTTRDVVDITVRLGSAVLRLSDTAGIRATDDPVECIGVSLAKQRLLQADLVLAVFDSSAELTDEDKQLTEAIGSTPAIAVINKSDLPTQIDRAYIESHYKHIVEISAATGSGYQQLTTLIEHLFALENFDPMKPVLANARQLNCARRARALLEEALGALSLTLDAVCVNIDCGLDALMELTGERVSDTVIESVFERFCVGK